jgi:hypothetical protein
MIEENASYVSSNRAILVRAGLNADLFHQQEGEKGPFECIRNWLLIFEPENYLTRQLCTEITVLE